MITDLSPITEQDKKEICYWRYEGVYSVYNLPSYAELKDSHVAFMHPEKEKNYYVFRKHDKLIGYVNILEKPTGIFIGIGIAPNLCGQGYGRQILSEAVTISKELYPQKVPYLEVRSWNNRAIQCYKSAGFQIDGQPYFIKTRTGTAEFYRMVYVL